jgi:hypothetical protein
MSQKESEVSSEVGLCMKMTKTGVGFCDHPIVRRLTVLCALGRHTNQNLLTDAIVKSVRS